MSIVVLPRIVCLCGSTRFWQAYQEANERETLAGRIVLTVGNATELVTVDSHLELAFRKPTAEAKIALDELHKRKIDLADEILVLNVGGYIGESTRSEVAYARQNGKVVRWLEPKYAVTHV